MYSPPFRPLTEEEDEAVVKQINDTKPDFIWIGLGAPKQEKWMAAHAGMLHGVMLGVGAGFDFHAGTVRRAPGWMQELLSGMAVSADAGSETPDSTIYGYKFLRLFIMSGKKTSF